MSESLAERVRTATETELGRLSGDKVLLGATGASLDRADVLGAIRRALGTAATETTAWQNDVEDDVEAALGLAVDGFEAAEATLATAANGDVPDGPVVLALGSPPTALELAGAGCIGAPLVLDGLLLQGVSFFVNEADPDLADRCRSVREELSATRETAGDRLAAACTDEADDAAVVSGGVGAIEASYERYVALVTELGLDPKPIC